MNRRVLTVLSGLLFPFAVMAQTTSAGPPATDSKDSVLAVNTSQYGVKYPEKFVLLQNRMGIRIEYVIDRGRLQLWISPQAGKSMSYRDRNFSNRDDHSDIFERILLPDLNPADFLKCDYDPFHSVLHFKNQRLHLAHVYDQPVVLIWFERDSAVDLKSAKDDHPVERTARLLHVRHSERGYSLDHVAAIGAGAGSFQHQPVLDEGRAIHARAHLRGGQVMAIGAELQSENVSGTVARILAEGLDATLAANEKKIASALDPGRFTLRDRPEMQKLLDVSRRVALSMQDERGFMRSTSQYIYYLLWFRDGGLNTAHLALSGWTRPARWQTEFALRNPNSATHPAGIFYGQLMAGPITKWEEDGLFYVIWPAFLYWTQSGDNSLIQGEYLKTMEDAMDWLERYSFDPSQGLFGRYYYGESMLTGSRDDGFDSATGAPSNRLPSEYDGHLITRSYDVYINSLNLACYYMLAAMETGARAEAYLTKARALEVRLRRFYQTEDRLPSYGDLLAVDGAMVRAKPYAMDKGDYQWALSLPPFRPFLPRNFHRFGRSLSEDLRNAPTGNFLSSYNAVLTSLDTELYNEDEIMAALDYLVPQSVEPGRYLPMPNTVPEMVNVAAGDLYHDVRPIVFSIAPWLSAVTNLGLRRLPFGLAVRGTKYLERIDHYEYRGGVVDVTYRGNGKIARVFVNGQQLNGSLQIPEDRFTKGVNRVEVEMSPSAVAEDRLIASTVRLDSIQNQRLQIHAFGQNVLTFKNLRKAVSVSSATGDRIRVVTEREGDVTWIDFTGQGDFVVTFTGKTPQ